LSHPLRPLRTMRGGLRERRPGVWEVRAESGRDPLTGRRRQISKTVHGRKREVQRVLNALLAEADQGNHLGTDAPLSAALGQWLSMMEGWLNRTTVRRYRGRTACAEPTRLPLAGLVTQPRRPLLRRRPGGVGRTVSSVRAAP
jgi:hypothetical protein